MSFSFRDCSRLRKLSRSGEAPIVFAIVDFFVEVQIPLLACQFIVHHVSTQFQEFHHGGNFDTIHHGGGCMFDFVKITTVLYHKNIKII